jgi:serine/threonine protein kinase
MLIKFSKSQFKQITNNYKTDHLFPVIDIAEQINKDKEIKKCKENEFLYNIVTNGNTMTTTGGNFLRQISFADDPEKTSFVLDNGRVVMMNEYFDVEKLLGQGSYGVVLGVYDKLLKRHAALKIIKKDKLQMNEIMLLKSTDHPNIIKLYSVHKNSNYYFLVMELLEGGSLKQKVVERYNNVKTDVLFKESEVAVILKGVLSGLNYMHNNRIVHRDIKPENIMFGRKDDLSSVKIVDFGLSNIVEDTKDDTTAGTVVYMPPELIMGYKSCHKVDIWACGFILFLLCSGGKHPVLRNSDQCDRKVYIDSMKKIFKTGWDLNDLPLLVRQLFLKLCKYDPGQRYNAGLCLLHPWITRQPTDFPLTELERLQKRLNISKLRYVSHYYNNVRFYIQQCFLIIIENIE